VKLGAPVAVLEAREASERLAVFQGLARGMVARGTPGAFDVEADTSLEGAEAIVQRIVSTRRQSGPRAST
jgi:hypothetical protein